MHASRLHALRTRASSRLHLTKCHSNSAPPGIPSSGPSLAGTPTSPSWSRRTSTSSASASSPGPPWSPPRATSSSTGSSTPSASPKNTTSPSSSARPPPRRPRGSRRSTPKHSAPSENGRKDQHGNRQQFDWSNPKYRELCRIIATKLAERFGHDPNVIGWQIDNEYAAESYGPETRAQFQQWLKARYKTLDNLNTRWTTAYWSETYTAWDQIPIQETYGNPGLLLNWKQFVSDTWRSYQRNQLDAIRAHADKRQFITTNMMGWFDAYDQYTVAQDLDLASWDDYVGTGQLNPSDERRTPRPHPRLPPQKLLGHGDAARLRQLVRGQQRPQQGRDPRDGMATPSATAPKPSNTGSGAPRSTGRSSTTAPSSAPTAHPVPLYAEVQQIGSDFDKAGPVLAGTTVHSDVALLNDYPSRWAIDWQRHNKAFDPINAFMSFYTPLHDAVRSVDIIPDTVPLDHYKLVVAPALNVLTPEAAKNLEAYVRSGGHLVLGPRSAMKDEDNSLWPQRQPGPLAEVLGAKVEQFYALDTTVPVSGDWGSGEDTLWAEQLSVVSPDTKILMRYGKSNGWLDDQPAAVTRKLGNGTITYIGASLDPAAMKRAAAWMLSDAGLAPVLPNIPEGVDVAIRTGKKERAKHILILTNYNADPVTIALPSEMHDILAGNTTSSITLQQYGVAVLQQ